MQALGEYRNKNRAAKIHSASNMKFIVALLLLLACAGVARADDITGNLTFTCRGGCFDTPNSFGYLGTAPVGTYDYTNGDLIVNAVWDPIPAHWDFGSLSSHF